MQPCNNLSAAIVPSEWCSALIHPILKPNTPDPRNYRGIALQSVVLQVLCKVLNARRSKTNYILSDEQNCFRPDHSCLDQLCHLQCNWSQKKKLPTFVAFEDLRKAFDSVDRDLLSLVPRHFSGGSGLGTRLRPPVVQVINLLKSLCRKSVKYRDTHPNVNPFRPI